MSDIDPRLERNRHFATVSGHVYEVATGLITTILPAAPRPTHAADPSVAAPEGS